MTTPAPTPVLGIDVSKLNFDAALLDPSHLRTAPSPATGPSPTRPPASSACRSGSPLGDHKVHACLEATGTYGDALARFLHEQGHTVSVVNPARIKGFGQAQMSRTKTDKADAVLIARFCLLHRPEPWTPPPRRAPAPGPGAPPGEPHRDAPDGDEPPGHRRRLRPRGYPGTHRLLDTQIEKTERRIRDHIDRQPHPEPAARPARLASPASAPRPPPPSWRNSGTCPSSRGRVRWRPSRAWCPACASPASRRATSGSPSAGPRGCATRSTRRRSRLCAPTPSSGRGECGAGYSWRASPLTPPSAPPSSPSRKGAKRSSKNSRPPLDKQHSI